MDPLPQPQTREIGGYRALVVGRTGQEQPPERLIVFLPGFLAAPRVYRQFLTAITRPESVVVAPRLYRPSPSVLAGRFTADDESERAVELVERLPPDLHASELWLAGHSRGGQAAWLAAARLARSPGLAGPVVIDPVDGAGRHP